jgi:Ca2+-binding RTX toxin-like protein
MGTSAAPVNQTCSSINIGANNNMNNDDTIYGGNDDDMMVGGHGNDLINGNDGNDEIICGHNINGGYSDGNDTANGGNGHGVIIGENGALIRTVISLPICASWPISSTNDW